MKQETGARARQNGARDRGKLRQHHPTASQKFGAGNHYKGICKADDGARPDAAAVAIDASNT